MARKLTKRELQTPDKFQVEAGGWLDWAHEHPRQVALGGAGLLVIIFAIGVIFSGGSGPDASSPAGRDLADALELVGRPVAAEGVVTEGGPEPFASEKAKQEAIAAALVEVRTKHPGTSSALSATLPLADAQFKLGRYDEAIALYDEYLAKAGKESHLRFLALEGRAQAFEAKGDLEQAIVAWDRLGAEVPAQRDRALFGKAQVLERQQKWDAARAAYLEIQKDFAEGPIARLAGDKLAALDRRHPPADAAAAAGE